MLCFVLEKILTHVKQVVRSGPAFCSCSRGRPNSYVTEEIRALMRTRDEWKRIFKKTKDPLAWSAYKNFSREVKHEIRMAERNFIASQIRDNKNNTNSLWKSIRSCIPKKSASQKTYSKDTKILADEFNQFFASVGENTVKKINALHRETGTSRTNY